MCMCVHACMHVCVFRVGTAYSRQAMTELHPYPGSLLLMSVPLLFQRLCTNTDPSAHQ